MDIFPSIDENFTNFFRNYFFSNKRNVEIKKSLSNGINQNYKIIIIHLYIYNLHKFKLVYTF